MQLSKYLTLQSSSKSDTALKKGIDNIPGPVEIESLKLLGENVYDKVKDKFPEAFPTSVFRSKKLNTIIGGATSSQHCKGEAIDIDSPTEAKNAEIFKFIKDNLEFDQLIAEFCTEDGPAWCHVSFKAKGNRKQILTADGTIHTGQGATYKSFTGQESFYTKIR